MSVLTGGDKRYRANDLSLAPNPFYTEIEHWSIPKIQRGEDREKKYIYFVSFIDHGG